MRSTAPLLARRGLEETRVPDAVQRALALLRRSGTHRRDRGIMDPGSAAHRFALRSIRGTLSYFFVLSTSAPFLIHGIMSRSLTPTSSIGCCASLARVALNEVWLTLFSSIQSRANLPDCMSASTRFISRSEEHTSELQSQSNLVCRLLLG